MGEVRPEELGETPTLEVLVYRNGELIHREFCESEDEAADVVATWEESPGVECVVDDVSGHQHGLESFEVEPVDTMADYPREEQ